MINKLKVVDDIKNDGKYDAILDVVKQTLQSDEPTKEQIAKLVDNDMFYIKEYKDLNRWGELSSVHVNELELKQSDTWEYKELKKQINKNVTYLKNGEEYEIKQKNIIYLAWTGFIALPSIYVIDNLVRIMGFYDGNENSVYVSFLLVVFASIWGYMKVTKNHKRQHEKYTQTQVDTRALIQDGLKNKSFAYEEVYQH
ncbi:MAG: hypothetical protein GQ474_02350 [Sulfurimonas sp.]|nr:hypothetical protein [Sulfurimonas sp.]